MNIHTSPITGYQKQMKIIENEILKLKGGLLGFSKKNISLKGILKGIEFTEEEIGETKKSLFKHVKA